MTIIAKGLCIGFLISSFTPDQTAAVTEATQLSNPDRTLVAVAATIVSRPKKANRPNRANFKQESASVEAHHLADWIVDSGDNNSMPFAIVDKTNAKVFVFHWNGLLRGAAPVLLGQSHGDESVPGIGSRRLSSIRPEERTTPAGRFIAELGRNSHSEEILWVDYDASISLHRVITTNLKEQRLHRLATPTPLDNRITYGCINVPANFYNRVVRPAFTRTKGIIYVLPDTRLIREVFPLLEIKSRSQIKK